LERGHGYDNWGQVVEACQEYDKVMHVCVCGCVSVSVCLCLCVCGGERRGR
jgi:hypothetical protein